MPATPTTPRRLLRTLTVDDLDALAALDREPTFWHHPSGRGWDRARGHGTG